MSVGVSERIWWMNKPLIDREIEICQTELQGLGGIEEKSLTDRCKSIAKSMEAWHYRAHLGTCK